MSGTCGCGGCMCSMCGGVISVLFLAAGALLYMGNAMYAGVVLVLIGLGKLVHVAGMCPSCKPSMEMKKGK